MASILKVDTIQDQSGNNIINESGDTITIGASGDTITIPTGATLTVPNGGLSGQNYPAFEAYGSANQTGISSGTWTKIAYNTERFDTNSMYDNSTNYRFTPTIAGKYFVYLQVAVFSETNFKLYVANGAIYKNGTRYLLNPNNANNTYPENERTISINAVIDMNGTTDYVEGYARGTVISGTVAISHGTLAENTNFGAYRIGA